MTRTPKILLAALAVISIAVPSLASAHPDYRGDDTHRSMQDQDRANAHRDTRPDDRHDPRDNGRDRRLHDRWDEHRHNGYMAQRRWYYGPPPAHGYYQPGYRAWSRGQYLAPYYRQGVIRDYGRYRLRPPPRGYNWVRADHSIMLVNTRNGLILEVIIGDW